MLTCCVQIFEFGVWIHREKFCYKNVRLSLFIFLPTPQQKSRTVFFCIATGYWLVGPVIESRWRRDFPHLSKPAVGPTLPPVQWVPGLSRGLQAAGAWRWLVTPSSAEVWKPSSATVITLLSLRSFVACKKDESFLPFTICEVKVRAVLCNWLYRILLGFTVLLSVGPAESHLAHCSLSMIIVVTPLLVPSFISSGAPRQTAWETSLVKGENMGEKWPVKI
jgi:hypothetical protein